MAMDGKVERCTKSMIFLLLLLGSLPWTVAASSNNFQAAEHISKNGFLNVTISIDWLWSLNGTRYAPAYNGAPVGPTLRLKPGDTLTVILINNLEPESEYAKELKTYTSDPTNNRTNVTIIENRLSEIGEFHDPAFGYWGHNFMNLHWHGARFESTIEDIGFALDGGGEQRTYTYILDENQPPGLAWYHNHFHGTTGYSYLSGLHGAVIIEGENSLSTIPEVANAEEVILFLSESRVDPNSSKPVNFVPIAGDFEWDHVTNGQLGNDAVYYFQTGKVIFFRMISSTVEANIDFSIDNHTMYLLAFDGYPIPSSLPKRKEILTIDSGSRVEILVKFDTPGTYFFRRLPWNYGATGTSMCKSLFDIDSETCVSWDQEQIIAKIVVADAIVKGESSSNTPLAEVAIPGYHPSLIAMASETPIRNRFVFLSEASFFPLFQIPYDGPFRLGRGFGVNNKFYDPHTSAGELEAGTCETWTVISNAPNVGHPFHVHAVPFLVTHIGGNPVYPPFWRDTMALNALDMKIHICFPLDPGNVLVHCHMATHLDVGMAANYHVVPAVTLEPSAAPVTLAPTMPLSTQAPATTAPTLAPATSLPTPAPIAVASTPAPATSLSTHAPATTAPTLAPATSLPTPAPITVASTPAPATSLSTQAPVTTAPKFPNSKSPAPVVTTEPLSPLPTVFVHGTAAPTIPAPTHVPTFRASRPSDKGKGMGKGMQSMMSSI
jgi:FtsP/CotA-like multicopper oxidase with cupredoxin domain